MADYQCSRCSDRGGVLDGGVHCSVCCDLLEPCNENCIVNIVNTAEPGDTVESYFVDKNGKSHSTAKVVKKRHYDKLEFEDGSTLFKDSLAPRHRVLKRWMIPGTTVEMPRIPGVTIKTEVPFVERLLKELATSDIGKYSARPLNSYGARVVVERLLEIFKDEKLEIPGGYETYTWIDEKCRDAFCGKSKGHTGHCEDSALPVDRASVERQGLKEITLAEAFDKLPQDDYLPVPAKEDLSPTLW